ncbi:MAG: hypothetical protein JNM63_16710, partial [Spirochaetia bacterium]|nr:hypothetical protein [Spirochaetia bacterium]
MTNLSQNQFALKTFALKNASRALAVCLAFAVFSCTMDSDRKEEASKSEIRHAILPPVVAFTALKNKMIKVNWSKHLDGDILKPKAGLIGFQIGMKLPNLVLAYFTKDDKISKDISQNLLELGKAIDIDDEAVLIKMKDRVKSIDNLVREEKDQAYQDLIQEVSGL